MPDRLPETTKQFGELLGARASHPHCGAPSPTANFPISLNRRAFIFLLLNTKLTPEQPLKPHSVLRRTVLVADLYKGMGPGTRDISVTTRLLRRFFCVRRWGWSKEASPKFPSRRRRGWMPELRRPAPLHCVSPPTGPGPDGPLRRCFDAARCNSVQISGPNLQTVPRDHYP